MLDQQSDWYLPPQPSVFLRPGTIFKGTHLVLRRRCSRENWEFVVSIEVSRIHSSIHPSIHPSFIILPPILHFSHPYTQAKVHISKNRCSCIFSNSVSKCRARGRTLYCCVLTQERISSISRIEGREFVW